MISTAELIRGAVAAKQALSRADTETKNRVLSRAACLLRENIPAILAANARDVAAVRATMSPVMLDRLSLSEARIRAMADGVEEVVALPDPVGEVLSAVSRPNGLEISKVSVPMGVIAIIFESRPNVTSDAAALCLKSGNVCVLRGGKEAICSNMAIAGLFRRALEEEGLPGSCVNLVEDTGRQSATELMTAVGQVDLLIPRGGAGLIRACVENARVPCIHTGTGICHIYVDGDADQDMALAIVENAKASRPSVCNAAEVCLVDRRIAGEFLPKLQARLVTDRNAAGKPPVELRLDEEAGKIIPGVSAGAADFDTEFLDYVMAVGIVSGVDEAVAHVTRHSTGHSECIVTEDAKAAETFLNGVDSAAVYVNASTRFTDGGEFGLGCEIGISTQKMHARGPMGLREMTGYKYVVRGNGQTR